MTEAAGVAGRGYDLGVVSGRLRQRRRQRPVRRGPAPQHALPQQRRRHLHRRDRGCRPRAPGREVRHALGDRGRLLRLRPRRTARPVRLQLRRLGPGAAIPAAATRRRPTTAARGTTRACRTRSSTTTATAASATSRPPPASAPTSARAWESASPTSTATAGADVFVANDTVPSFLFMNDRDGTFTESAFERGVALHRPRRARRRDGRRRARRRRRRPPRRVPDGAHGRHLPAVPQRGRRRLRGRERPDGRGDAHAALDRLGQRHRRLEQRRLQGPVRGLRRRPRPARARRARACRCRTPSS